MRGENKLPKCPRCGGRLRVRPGTKRTDRSETLRFQCRTCLESGQFTPEDCEWHPVGLALLEMTEGD